MSMIAAICFGVFLVRADGTAGTAVIRVVAMNIDALGLFIYCAKRFIFILTRCQNTLSLDPVLVLRTGFEVDARTDGPAVLFTCFGIDTRTVANHLIAGALALALSADFVRLAWVIEGTTCIMGVFFTTRYF